MYDSIVIGAGIAGSVAARKLAEERKAEGSFIGTEKSYCRKLL